MVQKLLLALITLSLFTIGLSQRCMLELHDGLDTDTLTEPITGRDAAVYLKRAVDLLEPVLPQLVYAGLNLPVAQDDPEYQTVRYLAERGLLSPDWHAGEIDAETWRDMLGRLASWYDVTPETRVLEPLSKAEVILSLSELIDKVALDLKPVALVASDPVDRNRVAFWAVLRNEGIYPRLIVIRPPEGTEVTLREGVQPVLPALGNCALTVNKFIFAPADTAQRLFLANNAARMVVAQTDEPDFTGLLWVPVGEEMQFFSFNTAMLQDAQQYAALFEGPTVGVMTLMTIIPQLRTNMNPREIIDFVRMQ
jgi:hypothetical protein